MFFFLLFDNCILWKLLVQHPIITFCMVCSLPHRLFWSLCVSFVIWYFYLQSQSIVLFYGWISKWCLDYPIFRTKNWWSSVVAHFHDRVTNISCTDLPEKAPNTSYINFCHKVTLWLPKMQDQESFTLHWRSFSGWWRDGVTMVFAVIGGQYNIYACVQPVTT